MGDRSLVFGIDLITGSARSKTVRPKYALIIVEDGSIIGEETVSLYRLLRLVERDKPEILAVDSIQEIAPHTQDLYRFIEELGTATHLVSVTGGEKQVGLIQVASRYNITFNRFDPFGEARAIALVAYQGEGVEVVAFEKETEIVISRNRSPGKGGWSQNRYARKIHGHVLKYAREIEYQLQQQGLYYWKKEFKAFGGVSRVVLHVRAQRDEVPVSSSRGGDVQIRVSGKRLNRIQFRSLSGRPRYLIIGMDPGTTIGLAALDLNGELVSVHSSRQMTMAVVTEFLCSLGRPIIIASDVANMPFSVEKIRRAFQAVAYNPKQDISVEMKYELAGKFKYSNDHERDALTAAIDAWRHWKHKFAGILKRVPQGVDLDEVKAGLIRGLSLEQILDSLRKTPKKSAEKRPEIKIESSDERVSILDGMVKDLRSLIVDLQKDLEAIRSANYHLKDQLKDARSRTDTELKRDQEIQKRDLIIENLKRQLRHEERNNKKLQKRLKRIKEVDTEASTEGMLVVKVLQDLSRESMRILTERMGLKPEETVYVKSLTSWGKGTVHELADARVHAVILSKTSESLDGALSDLFFAENLPLLISDDVPVQVKGDLGYCDEDLLDEAIHRWRNSLDRFDRERKEEMLDWLMKEYLAERERGERRHG